MSYEEAEKAMDIGQVVGVSGISDLFFKSHLDSSNLYKIGPDNKVTQIDSEKVKKMSELTDNFRLVEPTKEQSDALEKFWNKQQATVDKEASKQRDEYESLKAVAHAGSRSSIFRKLSKKISISDLENRKNLPAEAQRESVFLMSNGFVFDMATSQLTNRQEQDILKSLK